VAGRDHGDRPRREAEQVIDDLAREWEGWIDVELLGPVAAYDFVETAKPGS
jgi:hypothetical protein